MSDEREPSSEVSRRRFLTVLGTTSAGAAVLSGCSTEKVEKLIPYLVQSEDQVPGHPDLVREHVHRVQRRVRPARARARRPPRQARGQSRAIRSTGARSAPAGRPACRASTTRGACAPDGEAGRHLEGDQLGRCHRAARAEGRRGGRQARRHLRRGAGHASPASSATGPAAAGGRVVRYQPFDLEPVRAAQCARLRPRRDPGATTSARRSTSSPSARTSSRPSARAPSTSSATPSRTGSPRDASRPSTSTSRRARRSPASTPTSGMRSCRAPRRPSRSPWQACSCSSAAAACPACRRSVWRRPRRRRACPRRRSRGWRRSLRRPSPSLAVAGGIGSQTAGATELCAAVNLLNFAAGNVGQTVRFGADLDHGDGFGALEALSQVDGGRRGRAPAGARGQPGLHRAAQARSSARRWPRCPSRSRTGAVLRRDGRGVRPAAAEPPRARALGRPQPAQPATGA